MARTLTARSEMRRAHTRALVPCTLRGHVLSGARHRRRRAVCLCCSTWIQKAGMYDATPLELYGVCLYCALANMFGGYAEHSPANYVEFYIQCFMTLLGSCIWAYIISAGCGVISTLDPQGVEFRQTMDELNYFSRDKNLPMDLTIRLRTFFQNTQHVIFARQYDQLLHKMSPLLRGEAALKVAAQSIGKLPYFGQGQVESHFLASAALAMKVSIYSLREAIPIEHLTIIERGIAAKAGRLKIKGQALGHDMILELSHLRDWSPCTALTVTVQVMYLPREHLLEILPHAPRAMEKVRQAAFRIAFQRLVQRVAEEYRIAKALAENSIGGKLDFLRLAIPTAVQRAHDRAKLFGGLDAGVEPPPNGVQVPDTAASSAGLPGVGQSGAAGSDAARAKLAASHILKAKTIKAARQQKQTQQTPQDQARGASKQSGGRPRTT